MIYKWCPSCKSSNAIQNKRCQRCNIVLENKYRVIVSNKGKRQSRLVDSLSMARDIEATIKSDLLREEFDIKNHRVKRSFALNDVWAEYLPHIKLHKKSWITDQFLYDSKLKVFFGDKKLDDITPLMVKSFIRFLMKSTNKNGGKYTPATIKHFLVLLRRLFTIAETWEQFKFDGKNPVEKGFIPKLDNEIVRYLSDEQQKSLFDTLDLWPCKESSAFIKVLIFTGFRRGELFRLKWLDIDFDNSFVTLQKPKGGKTATLPVNDLAISVFKSIPKNGEYVFPGKAGGERENFKGAWLRIRKQAGLPEYFRLHDLRHHFASILVSNGIDILTVSKLLNHKDSTITRKYAHLSDLALRKAADKAGTLFTPK
jgi:integrase